MIDFSLKLLYKNDVMKKLPLFLVIISLIAGSLFSAMHADASSISDDSTHIIKSMDDSSDDNVPAGKQVKCHHCSHAGCSHIALNQQLEFHSISSASSKHFISSGETYLSQLNSPPSQPPRA